jgi:hypothetical protein
LCLEAVKSDGLALQYVPWGQLNLTVSEKVELCREAMRYMPYYRQGDVSYVPEELREEVSRRRENGE